MKLKQLYRFAEGSTVWTYTSSDVQELHNGETYEPITIGRSEPQQGNNIDKQNLEITLPIENELSIRNLRNVIETQLSVTVFSQDPDTLEFDTEWKGRLASTKPGVDELLFVFESVFTSLRRPGVRKRAQRNCTHSLYGRGCNLLKALFAVSGSVTAVDGVAVTLPAADALPDGWFSGGMIEAPDGSLRFILSHVGSQLTLIRPLDGLMQAYAYQGYGNSYGYSYGQLIVTIYPGCDRTKETCFTKFNNIINRLGFDWMPLKNPVGGTSIV